MRKLSYMSKKAMYGRGFIFLWTVGVALFFVIPFVQTIIYSFSNIKVDKGGSGFLLQFAGAEVYKKMFTVDAEFLPRITSSLLSLIYDVPLIVMFALAIAVLLNAKFPGRTFFRAVFFLPVIVMSGTIMLLFKSDSFAAMLFVNNGTGKDVFDNITVLNDIFSNVGFGEKIISFLQTVVSKVLDVCWSSGVQFLLCLAALQGIPSSLYEASKVEGATKWDEFWKITFPMSTPVLFICVIYTIVVYVQNNNFTAYIKQISFTNFDYAYGSALSMFYCLTVLIIIGVVSVVLRKWNQNAKR